MSESIHPLYHVNTKTELVSEQTKTNPAPIIIAVVTLTIISTAVIVAVIRHLKVSQSSRSFFRHKLSKIRIFKSARKLRPTNKLLFIFRIKLLVKSALTIRKSIICN